MTGGTTLDAVIAQAEQLRAEGRAEAAAERYEQWIAQTGESATRCVALFNLGVLRSDLGEVARAEAAYTEAVRLNPRFYQARINLGLTAERQNRDTDAARQWLAVAEAVAQGHADAAPFATVALNHLGRLQETRRNFAAAESALTHSLHINPAQPDAIQHWVHLRQKQCSWPVYTPLPGLSVNALMAATSPLAMLAQLDDPAMQWMTAHAFVTRKYGHLDSGGVGTDAHLPAFTVPHPASTKSTAAAGGVGTDADHPASTVLHPASTVPHPASTAVGERMRIGYLSGDLCTHAVGLLMAELLEAHDRTRVHVTAFDFSPEDGTAVRARLRRACDDMLSIRTMTDHNAAHAIRERRIDVLIDMHGLSSGARPGILAERPAPLMGGYLGFIGTTAMPWLDFVVTDAYTMPETVTPYITEEPLYIDGSMIPLFHQPVDAGRFTREMMHLPADAVVLASFNNIYKVTPDLFAVWMHILHRAPQAVLWLLDDNPWATASLKAGATKAGVDPARLVFAGRSSHADYRARMALADLYLDTYPYNAGSTARDVLDANVPLITLSGRTPVSRMAGGLLHAAGLEDLIATSYDEYERLTLQLIEDAGYRASVRRRMRDSADDWRAAPARAIRSLEEQLARKLEALRPRTSRR